MLAGNIEPVFFTAVAFQGILAGSRIQKSTLPTDLAAAGAAARVGFGSIQGAIFRIHVIGLAATRPVK